MAEQKSALDAGRDVVARLNPPLESALPKNTTPWCRVLPKASLNGPTAAITRGPTLI